ATVRVETDRKEQRGQVERAVVQVAGLVVRRDRVQVDDAEEGLAFVLRRDVLAHRAYVVADVLGTRRLDAREHAHGRHLVEVVDSRREWVSGRGGVASAGLRLARGATTTECGRRRSRIPG